MSEEIEHPNSRRINEMYARDIADDIIKGGFKSILVNVQHIIGRTMEATREYDGANKK